MGSRRSIALTPKEVEERLEEAARTLRRLPDDRRQGYFSVWPSILHDKWEILAMEPRPMKILATPQAIDRMDECFDWILWLETNEARVVWLRAEGVRWKPICRRLGVSRATAWRWWATALMRISHRLKTDEKARTSKPKKQAS